MTKRPSVLVWVFAGAAVASLILFFWRTDVEIYRDARVVVSERRTWLNYISAHASTRKYLTVHGHEFAGVRGSPPYYLEVKSLEAILFVTQDRAEEVSFILAFDRSKEIVRIPAGNSGFGWNIGSKRPAGGALTDAVESADSQSVVLSRVGLDWKEITTLDLQTKMVQVTTGRNKGG